MSDDLRGSDMLGAGIAAVLRVGTLVAMAVIAIGYVIGRVAGMEGGHRPLTEQLASGGPVAIIAAGLLGLTLLPAAVLGVAAAGFARNGEWGRMWTALAVLALLLASLVAAWVLAGAG